ncbi:hypothetical protein [Arenimonas sp.]|uniref:hypothetical protein n=1 Tax=Arenimonas sp. TaxID=1872635 RepID=UPI0035B393C0
MALPDWLRQSTWPAAGAALAGLVLGALVADGVADSGEGVADVWTEPGAGLLGRVDEGSAATVAASPLWRGAAAATPEARAATQWKLLGIVDGNPPMALVSTAGANSVARLGLGEALPDGRRIADFQDAAVVVADDSGCRTTYKLYQGASDRPETSCDTAAPASDPAD